MAQERFEVRTVKEHLARGHEVMTAFKDSPGLNLIIDLDDQSVMAWSPSDDHAQEMARNLNRK